MFSKGYQNFLIVCLSLTFLFNYFRCNSKLLTLCVIQLVHLKWRYRADCFQLTRMCDVIPFEALKREGKVILSSDNPTVEFWPINTVFSCIKVIHAASLESQIVP